MRSALGFLCLGLALLATPVAAETYPNRPVRFVVGYPAGGTTDILARIMGQRLSELLGQQFVIDNRPGAGNNLGTEMVVNAPADGYTLLLVNPANAINETLYPKLNFVFLRDLTGVAGFVRVPNVMEVNPNVPAKTVQEFIALAKAKPNTINMASTGNGTSTHMSGELFRFMAGIEMTHVPYRGAAPALTDLIAGQVQVLFDNLPSSIGHIQSGALRAIAVTSLTRAAALPDVPTVAESGVPGYEATAFFGMGAPKATPPEVIAILNRTVNAALKEPATLQRLAELGGDPLISTPAEFTALIDSEIKKWADVVKRSGAKVD